MFVRYVSHEIRTPLNTACLGLQYLQDELTVKKSHGVESSSMMSGAKASALNEIVEQIHCSCDIAVNILNDLLTYEKLEGGILESHMKRVCVWSLLRETIRLFQLQVLYEVMCHLLSSPGYMRKALIFFLIFALGSASRCVY